MLLLFTVLMIWTSTHADSKVNASFTAIAKTPIERVRQAFPDYPEHSDISGLRLAYSIPLLIDPDSSENKETNVFCQLFTTIHVLRESDKEMFKHKSYPGPPDIIVPIHHVSNSRYEPSANITKEAKRLKVKFIYGGPCQLPNIKGSTRFSLLDYHVNDRAPFMMLNSFGLYEYDHVLHLDINVWPQTAGVEFFWHTAFNQPPDSLWGYYFSSNAPITRALLLVRPSSVAYTQMCQILDDGFGGADVGWNNTGRFESNWCDNPYLGCKLPHRWTFTRASMEIGVIYYYYHVRKDRYQPAANIIRERKFVFYSSNRKPWLPSHGKVWKTAWYTWEEDFLEMLDKATDEELCLSVRLEVKKWPKSRKRLLSCAFEDLIEIYPLPGFYVL